MMQDSQVIRSSEVEVHKRLVQLISEESDILEKVKCPNRRKRHKLILGFLIELQCISSRSLYEKN